MNAHAARRALAALTVAVGAAVAALALTAPEAYEFAFVAGGDRLDILFYSPHAATALSAVVAVVVATASARTRTGFWTAALGVVLLALATLVEFSGELHVRGLGAGVILGGCAILMGAHRILQCAMVIGALSGIVAAGPLDAIPRRYADYLEPTPQTYSIVLLGGFAVLLALSGGVSVFGDSPRAIPNHARVLLTGITIPVVGLILYWLFERSVRSLGSGDALQNRWVFGLVVIPLLVGAAFALPAVSGSVILAALAYIAVSAAPPMSMWTVIAFVVILVAGAAIGWRRPSPVVGMALLAVVAAGGILSGSDFEMVRSIADIVLLPFATGLVYASLLPTDAPVAVMSVTTPLAVSVPIVAEFGWTAYTPLSSIEPAFAASAWTWVSTAVSVFAVAAAGVSLVVLRRRHAH